MGRREKEGAFGPPYPPADVCSVRKVTMSSPLDAAPACEEVAEHLNEIYRP